MGNVIGGINDQVKNSKSNKQSKIFGKLKEPAQTLSLE